jgi:hypothetical protein
MLLSYRLARLIIRMITYQSLVPTSNSISFMEPLLTEYQFSAITGTSVATTRRNRLLGKGCPYVKLGALVRYRPEDVRDYISRNVRIHQEGR